MIEIAGRNPCVRADSDGESSAIESSDLREEGGVRGRNRARAEDSRGEGEDPRGARSIGIESEKA